MGLFNFLFLIIFFNVLLFYIKKKNKIIEKKIFILITFILYCLSFIRWEVGTDWLNYYTTFIVKDPNKIYAVNEIGYKLLNYYVGIVTSNYTVMLFVLATILFLFKYINIWKLSYYPLISLMISFAFYRGDIYFIRQHIAVAICVLSLKYYLQNKTIKFFLSICMATLIHSSAIIFSIIYILKNKVNFSKRFYIVFLIFSLSLIPFMNDIMWSIGESLSNVGVYGYKIKRYMLAGHSLFGANVKNIILLYSVAISNKIVIVFFFIYNLQKLDKNDKKLFNIYYFGTVIYILLVTVSSQLLRINIFFEIPAIILLANFLKYIKKKENKVCYILVISIYAYLKLLSGLNNQPLGVYIPYKSIFN